MLQLLPRFRKPRDAAEILPGMLSNAAGLRLFVQQMQSRMQTCILTAMRELQNGAGFRFL
jgi:hypothetical protein